MSTSFRVGFCVSGQGRLFRAAVLQRDNLQMTPDAVILDHNAAPELEEFAAANGVKRFRMPKLPREAFGTAITDLCLSLNLDLLCLTFDRLLPPPLVQHYRGKIINVHPALLPAFKGMRALAQAVAGGARYAGATIHEVNEGMDDGAIIAQCITGIRPNEEPTRIGNRLFSFLRPMYLQVIRWYAEGRVFKDDNGRIWVRDAIYGETPISPALEYSFADN